MESCQHTASLFLLPAHTASHTLLHVVATSHHTIFTLPACTRTRTQLPTHCLHRACMSPFKPRTPPFALIMNQARLTVHALGSDGCCGQLTRTHAHTLACKHTNTLASTLPSPSHHHHHASYHTQVVVIGGLGKATDICRKNLDAVL